MPCTQPNTYMPLISAGIGFASASTLFLVREWLDRRSRKREAATSLIFHMKILREYVSSRSPASPRAIAGFDESLRRLASARFSYYDWPELVILNKINVEYSTGELNSTTHLEAKLRELDGAIEALKGRLKGFV